MDESRGRTLNDACRRLTEQLSDQQRKALSHDNWLTEQIDAAFEKLDEGSTVFFAHDQAKADME